MGRKFQGSNSAGGKVFRTPSSLVLGQTDPLYSGYLVILRGKVAGEWRSTCTSPPVSSIVVVNEWSYTSIPTLCLRVPFWGDLYLSKLVFTTIQRLTHWRYKRDL